ncbi:mycothiol synthase [Zafaria sp. Z1313]|uniref:mycothiol synthase n=1 Tax=unclassified Zafaria TaxID=2828765 RepID=UPI002E7A6F4E|nr:mycothiol synthase [Zafaria sp. J156]MEE1620598.1 mycothiol synthase [Zafaria sp. J156]
MSATESTDWTITTLAGTPDADLLGPLRALAAAAEDSDGNPPLSEQTLVELGTNDDADALLGAYAYLSDGEGRDSAELVGLAVAVHARPGASHGTLELVVHPDYRNDGIGTGLVETLAARVDLGGYQAWSHGNHAGAARLAERHGFASVRELWRMRLVHHEVVDEPRLPDGVTLRAFVPGQDEEAWLAANAAAFADHAEQGSLTRRDLLARMDEDWFDPAGFLLAVDAGDRILGFHWTKVHPAVASRTTGEHSAIGEVYVVGVVPQAQGTGLGKALTLAGIRHLQEQGLQAVMLYVDADNTAAVGLYRKLGFTRWDVDVMYARAAVEAAGPAASGG